MLRTRLSHACTLLDIQYEALFDALRRFDRSTDLSGLHRPPHGLKEADKDEKPAKEEEITEHIVMSIINLLNKSCSHCHRKEYSQSIFALLGEFRGHLKDLAIGKQQLRISYWVQHLDIRITTPMQKTLRLYTIASRSQSYWHTTISSTSCYTISRIERLSYSITQQLSLPRKNLKRHSKERRRVFRSNISITWLSSYTLYQLGLRHLWM